MAASRSDSKPVGARQTSYRLAGLLYTSGLFVIALGFGLALIDLPGVLLVVLGLAMVVQGPIVRHFGRIQGELEERIERLESGERASE